MNSSTFKQIDVFTSRRFFGNGLAVVLDVEGLDGETMQRIAAWTNLSETAFVLPPTRPEADYRVRIFTPRNELAFAGHPSVGTAHALIESGLLASKEHLVQECAAGLLPVRVDGDGPERRVFVRAPRTRLRAVDAATAAAAAHALNARLAGAAAPQLADNGPTWLICDLGDEASVRSLAPDLNRVAAVCAQFSGTGISVFGRAAAADYAIVVRAFAPGSGVPEDPVTGSANASIGAYLHATGQLDAIGAHYRASQGREVGRDGRVDVHVDAASGEVEIGGCSVTCIDGMLVMPATAAG
jgi:PhzF family phenazine biosynthesis protein